MTMYTPSGINLPLLWTRQVLCQPEDGEFRTRSKKWWSVLLLRPPIH